MTEGASVNYTPKCPGDHHFVDRTGTSVKGFFNLKVGQTGNRRLKTVAFAKSRLCKISYTLNEFGGSVHRLAKFMQGCPFSSALCLRVMMTRTSGLGLVVTGTGKGGIAGGVCGVGAGGSVLILSMCSDSPSGTGSLSGIMSKHQGGDELSTI